MASKHIGRPGRALDVYTDGSASNGDGPRAGGWAWVCPSAGLWETGGTRAKHASSSTHMEAHAALQALRAAHPQAKVRIHTDCSALVTMFERVRQTGEIPTSWKNGPLVELVELAATRQVELRWVRGHAATPGNRLADRLAYHAMHMARDREPLVKSRVQRIVARVEANYGIAA